LACSRAWRMKSFSVSPTRQTYKCFGCGVYGNVIDFVMEYEKLDFREAMEKLADRAAVTLKFEGGKGPSKQERSLRSKALEMMEWAQRGFTANLKKHAPALEYLEARGLGGEVAERWGLRTRGSNPARGQNLRSSKSGSPSRSNARRQNTQPSTWSGWMMVVSLTGK